MIYEGEFKDDERNGYGKEYDENNNIIFEGQYLDGKRWEGFGKETNDKAIMFSGEYKNGKRNGAGKEYYCDKNSIKFNGNYLDGERSGKGIEYFENGKIKFIGDFFKGGYNNGKGYNMKREEIFEIKNGEGNIKIYNNMNEIEFEGEYKSYKYWTGKKSIYKDKALKIEVLYSKGEIIKLKEYSPYTGNLEFEGDVINGILKKGKEYEDNEVVFEGEYFSEGKLENNEEDYNISKKRWNGKGKEKRFLECLGSITEEIDFVEYKNLVYEGDYLEGKKTGFGKIYNEKTGALIYEGELLNCKKHGKGKLYDKKGNLKIEGDFIND